MSRDAYAKTPPVYGAFGMYRWVLASFVAIGHFGAQAHLAPARWAVMAFFTLSGYVACFTLENNYLHLKNGIARFYLNRFLRVYPLYWTACFLSYALMVIFPEEADHYVFGQFQLPHTWDMWLRNITAMDIYRESDSTLSTADYPLFLPLISWTLGVEFMYWLIMPLVVIEPLVATGFIAFGVGFHALMFSLGEIDNGGPYYFWASSAALYFASGYCLYQLVAKHGYKVSAWTFFISICVLTAMVSNPPLISEYTSGMGANISLFFTLPVIAYLASIDTKQWSASWQSIDRWLGHLSFGIYLLQIPMWVLAEAIFPALADDDSAWLRGICVLALSNIAAIYLHLLVEQPLSRLRTRVRTRPAEFQILTTSIR